MAEKEIMCAPQGDNEGVASSTPSPAGYVSQGGATGADTGEGPMCLRELRRPLERHSAAVVTAPGG